jgi:hypothetical protein
MLRSRLLRFGGGRGHGRLDTSSFSQDLVALSMPNHIRIEHVLFHFF